MVEVEFQFELSGRHDEVATDDGARVARLLDVRRRELQHADAHRYGTER